MMIYTACHVSACISRGGIVTRCVDVAEECLPRGFAPPDSSVETVSGNVLRSVQFDLN